MTTDTVPDFRETIQHHSKSFAFASALIPAESRHPVEVLYAWCRGADDAIDLAPSESRDEALAIQRRRLDEIYSDAPTDDRLVRAMQQLVIDYSIPRTYPEELLEGMAMDANGTVYNDMDTLLLYCYRVAGTVGLMMSHVLGVCDPEALQHAVHLGIAMQLTNICRDVAEDWENQRLYIPQRVLEQHGAGQLRAAWGQPLPDFLRHPLADCVEELLALADRYYASADAGMRCLPWRGALSVRAARHIYSEIGSVIRQRDSDVFAGRAVVPHGRKAVLAGRALVQCLAEAPYRIGHRFTRAPLSRPLHFPDDVLLINGGAQIR